MKENEVLQLSPLNLAFVGDAVYGLYIKQHLVQAHDFKTGELTKRANYFLRATTQAKIFEYLLPTFTEKEQEVARRCRNAHVNNKAKSATLSDYKRATALEGVFGFLQLVEEHERLEELLEASLNFKEDTQK
ncbi:MAG: Mini-ribonuclease 3 [Clostridia bacterium]|nr:Mini-ribonuclease 3 [Clostridia bacterium]